MMRPITGFARDERGDWFATLSCGHRQHTRHDPPMIERPWVLTPEGRAEKVGIELACARCDAREMPEGFVAYRQTASFDEKSVPRALVASHRTKPGVWARIRIERGALRYVVDAPFDSVEILTPGVDGIVLPEVTHHVEPLGSVGFHVEFWHRG